MVGEYYFKYHIYVCTLYLLYFIYTEQNSSVVLNKYSVFTNHTQFSVKKCPLCPSLPTSVKKCSLCPPLPTSVKKRPLCPPLTISIMLTVPKPWQILFCYIQCSAWQSLVKIKMGLSKNQNVILVKMFVSMAWALTHWQNSN